MTAAQPSLPALKQVAALLDAQASDVYPVDVRARLAACALRIAGHGRTIARQVDGATVWLRDQGHIR